MNDYGIPISLNKSQSIVKETLERIGIANQRTKIMTPTCYLIMKDGCYHLIHFKELLAMDGRKGGISESDMNRRNAIFSILINWGMIYTDTKTKNMHYQAELLEKIFILKHVVKSEYTLNHKYELKERHLS